MNEEKGGGIAFVVALALVGLWWLSQPEPKKADPIPIDNGLIDEVATIRDFLTVEPGHIVDANKMAEPQKEVIVFVSGNCPPCERWKRCEMQRFIDAGWKVAFCEQHSYKLTPTFLFTLEGRSIERVGYVSFEQLGEVLR
jgi:hypothetical protein